MESDKPMDNCCGDSYGKTEVALRAAFKVVMDGKQVAFSAHNYISEQHYSNMIKDFQFPVRRIW